MSANRIVVGLDGSDGALEGLHFAIALARDLGAEVVAVYGYAIPAYALVPTGFPAAPVDDELVRRELGERLTGDWSAPLRESGLPFRTRLADGSPAAVLMEAAEREDARMIVVGTRGMGGFEELLLGSVGHQLTHHASRPIVVVPPAR